MNISNLPSRLFEGTKTRLWNIENPGKMLMHTGAVGWALGSMAQVAGIAVNDKIDFQKKKFLIPQEIGDAAGNIALYYLVTVSLLHIAEDLFECGRIRFEKVEKALKKVAKDELKELRAHTKGKLDRAIKRKERAKSNELKQKAEQQVEKFSRDYKKLKNTTYKMRLRRYFNGNKSMTEVLNMKSIDSDIVQYFMTRKKGACIVASLIASIISCNILTPYLRNYIASNVQEKALRKHQEATSTLLSLDLNKNNNSNTPSAFKNFIV